MSETRWHVYMVRCSDDSLYTGVALDAHKRFAEHARGRGAKYTRAKGAVSLAYVAALFSKSQAFGVEWRIKRLKKNIKERIVRDQFSPNQLLALLGMPVVDGPAGGGVGT